MYVYVYTYIYIYIYILTMKILMQYIYIYIYTHMVPCLVLHVFKLFSFRACSFVCYQRLMPLFQLVCVYTYIYIYMYVCVTYIYIYIYICIYVYTSYIYNYTHIHNYMCQGRVSYVFNTLLLVFSSFIVVLVCSYCHTIDYHEMFHYYYY